MFYRETENTIDKTLFFENCRDGEHRVSPDLFDAYKAGVDLYLNDRRFVKPGQIYTFDTGSRVFIPQGHVGLIVPRASATKRGLIVITGTIDPEYTGTLTVALMATVETMLMPDDAVAQLLVLPVSDLWRDIGHVQGVPSVRGDASPFRPEGDSHDNLWGEVERELEQNGQ